MRGIVPFIAALFATAVALAQAPVIKTISPVNTHPNGRIVITGSGFSDTPTQLAVWFDQVKGSVVASSEFAIEVDVPAQAKYNNVEVINLATQLSVKSSMKFMPSVRTEDFNRAKFTAPLTFTASEELWDLCTCDLDTNGKPDIAATKYASPSSSYANSTDIMLLQNHSTPGNLSFTKINKSLGFATDHIVCGDLQGDGLPELIVSRAGSPRNSIYILTNTSTPGDPGTGTPGVISFSLHPALFLDVGHFATRMVLRDLNRDGKPEIIVTNSFNDVFYIFINESSSGTLSFNATPIKLSIKLAPSDILTTYEAEIQDFNGDHLPDIIINQSQTSNLYLLKNQSTGNISFGAPERLPVSGTLNRIISADLNKDGRLDLIITSTLHNKIDVLLNQSTSGSFAFSTPVTWGTSARPWGIDVSDIDGDEHPDIIVATLNQSNLTQFTTDVFLHDGNMTSPGFTREEIVMVNPLRNLKAGDFDGDGKPDIAYTSFEDYLTRVEIIRNTNCHKPQIKNEAPLVICNGKTVRLNTAPVPHVTFTWKEGTTTVGTNDPFLDITTPGTYTVTATSEGGGCVVQSEAVEVTTDTNNAPNDPTITTHPSSPLCVGTALRLSSDEPADEYIWTGPGTRVIPNQQDPSFDVTEDDAGIYSLQLRTGQCKSNVATIRIDVATLGDFAISTNHASNTVCDGETVTLSVNAAANHTYEWRKDGVAMTPPQTSSSLVANQEGAYTVRVTSTTLSCSTETAPVNVMILQPPVADFDVKPVACSNEQLDFTNQSQVDTRATAQYNWNFGNGTSTAFQPTNTYTTAQTYNPALTVSYQGVTGCSHNTSVSLNVVNGVQPSPSSTAPSSCPDKQVTLSVSGSFTSIIWSNGDAGNSTNVAPGSYTVNTVDANGCAGTGSITITTIAVPAIVATATPASIVPGESAQLLAIGADEYSWTPAETLDNPLIANPVASPAETTTYVVAGSQRSGCSSITEVTVTLEHNLNFPSGFSPNSDGVNDLWNIRAESTPECILSIFDGRGRRVFEKKGENWDGTYQGKPVPDGTYYYVYGCPNKKTVTGSVLVFK